MGSPVVLGFVWVLALAITPFANPNPRVTTRTLRQPIDLNNRPTPHTTQRHCSSRGTDEVLSD
jgi:hypothetical protein